MKSRRMKTTLRAVERMEISEMELSDLETVIKDGLETFFDVGFALARIREAEMYKAAGFKTFEAYCQGTFDMGRAYAYRLIAAAGVVENVANWRQDIEPPRIESHARELSKLPAEQHGEAWSDVLEVADGGKVTATIVKNVVAKRLPEKPKQEPAKRLEVSCPECNAKAVEIGNVELICQLCMVPMGTDGYDGGGVKCTLNEAWDALPADDRIDAAQEILCRLIDSVDIDDLPAIGGMLCAVRKHLGEEQAQWRDVEPASKGPTLESVERLARQRRADPDYQHFQQISQAVNTAIPNRAQRMATFVLDGGEIALARLGLDWSVTLEKLRAAYRAESKRLHPDTGGDSMEFVKLTEAFDLVKAYLKGDS